MIVSFTMKWISPLITKPGRERMGVISSPFRSNSVVAIFEQIFTGITHKTIGSVIHNFRENADYLPKLKRETRLPKSVDVALETKKGSGLNNESDNQDGFLKKISRAEVRLKAIDSALSQLSDFIVEAKNIAIQRMKRTSNHEARKQAAKEVEKLLAKIIETVNTQDVERHISVRNQSMPAPFQEVEKKVTYSGNTERIELRSEPGLNMKINSVDSNFLTKPLKTLGDDSDLDPGIDHNTRLSDLNRGKGINLGSIRITSSNPDTSWDIDLHSAVTVGDVISAINSSKIAGLSVEIAPSKKGLKLTHTAGDHAPPEQELTISDESGTTARDLGILCNPSDDSAIPPFSSEGQDLDPILTKRTPISLLRGGQGMSLGIIKIALGTTEKIVDLSSSSTIGEIISAINDSMPGVTTSVNNSKKGISIESTVPGKSLVVSDGDSKKTAHHLGISGSPDMGGTFLFLAKSLNNQDCEAISRSLEILDLGLEEISSYRAEAGAKLKRLKNLRTTIIDSQSDAIRALSEIRGADLLKAVFDLTNQKSIYQSALQRGAAMIQPTLLDFIR